MRYKLASKELNIDESAELATDAFYDMYVSSSGTPCRYVLKTHIWLFEGNQHDGSSLKSLSMTEGQLKSVSHTPPPFPCITDIVKGAVKREILDSLTPVRRYLHEKKYEDNSSDSE